MLDPRTISVVAWDLDNTLFDRDAAVCRFFEWYLARLGRESPQLLGAIMALDAGGDGDRLAFCRQVCTLCGHNPDTADDLWSALCARLPGFVRPDGAAVACLFRLRDRYPLALISNGSGALQRAKLQRAGIPHYFPTGRVFISGEVGFEKPDPRLFETALRTLGHQPERVLYVGDHPANDIAGAAAVGMRTCWVSRGRPQPLGLRADAIVENAGEIAPLILEPR
ncbi:MAG: HAD family hydrolase [Gluconacetobacter diazotrophicus]|nr:HAD family hydrolase [Gluconacetobacter diazotrophicus]